MKKNSGVIKFKISLGKFQADINLDPPQKNILALTGKSGSGKSTLAKVICGIHKPHSGEIVINDTTLFFIFLEMPFSSIHFDKTSESALNSKNANLRLIA